MHKTFDKTVLVERIFLLILLTVNNPYGRYNYRLETIDSLSMVIFAVKLASAHRHRRVATIITIKRI